MPQQTTKTVTTFFGSARLNGKTGWLLDQVTASFNKHKDNDMAIRNIDLYDYKISPLSRSFIENKSEAPLDDDMKELIPMILTSKVILLATPIYWFTVSGIMKNFLDRWYDFSDERAKLNLDGKGLAVLTAHANPSSTMPFPVYKMMEEGANFLNMVYLGGADIITSAESGSNEYAISVKTAELLGKRITDFLRYSK